MALLESREAALSFGRPAVIDRVTLRILGSAGWALRFPLRP